MALTIVGTDGGNANVKSASDKKLDIFPANICNYYERNLEETHGDNDMVVEYETKMYFAGSLAEKEDILDSGTRAGENKNHREAALRVLIAIYRQVQDGAAVGLVVNQPISFYKQKEKEGIIQKLQKEHSLTINGVTKKFSVEAVKVSAEAHAGYWSDPENGLIHVLDVGSATVNCATIEDGKPIDSKSFTLPFGTNMDQRITAEHMAEAIIRRTSKKWKPLEPIRICGGGGKDVMPFLMDYYFHVRLMQPKYKDKPVDPIFANALGNYNLAKGVFA